MTNQSLHGKVAVVTGAGDPGGIGASLALALGRAGASVMIGDINVDGAATVAASLRSEGITVSHSALDISKEDSVEPFFDGTVRSLGMPEILVNNAGLLAQLSWGVDLIDYPLDEWRKVLDVNLTGTLLCCRAAARRMRDQKRKGRIINISSGGAFQLTSPYSISKLAIVGMTVLLADQLGKHGINVNSIAPGQIPTPAAMKIVPPGSPGTQRFGGTTRIGSPADLHGALLLLASDAGDWITGQTLNVDGGWIKRI